MDRLKLTGEGPLPSTDEDSIFVGENDEKGVPDDVEDSRRKPTLTEMPAPGGGGAYPLPAAVVDAPDDDQADT